MHCCGHFSGISISIWIFSGYEAVFNYSLIALCSLSNSAAVHSASLSPKTELEVSIISFFDRMLQKWCFYTCYCLVLVARPCCSMYCNMQIYWRYTNHFQTHIQTFSWCPMHFAHCIIQNVLINVIHWSLLHLCVQGTCFDDVFARSYVLMAKHVAWLNIKIFCFKLLHHIEGDLFWSLGFSSMNLQYITELGCMSLKDVTKHLFVV